MFLVFVSCIFQGKTIYLSESSKNIDPAGFKVRAQALIELSPEHRRRKEAGRTSTACERGYP
jgi:hypothetical protein